MKTIILFLFLSLNLFAQSSLLTLFDGGTTVTPEPPTITTDGMAYYFDYTSLTDGLVANRDWVESVVDTAFNNAGAGTLTKSSGGIVTNGSAYFVNAGVIPPSSGGLSIDMIVNIADTTHNQGIVGYFRTTATEYGIGVRLADPDDDDCYLTLTGYDEAGGEGQIKINVFYGSYINQLVHLVFTWDGGIVAKMYINGELATSTTNYLGAFPSNAGLYFGYMSGVNMSNNGVMKRLIVYHKVLTDEEVTVNYNNALDGL